MRQFITSIGGGLLLVACNSDGNGSATTPTPSPVGTVTPTPTPTISPSPTSTPTPVSYTKIADLTGDQGYTGGCAATQPRLPGTIPLPFAVRMFVEAPLYGSPLPSYTAATQSYRFASGGDIQTFGPADLDASPPVGATAYSKPNRAGGGLIDHFSFLPPVVGGMPADYMRQMDAVISNTYYCAFGVITIASDVPTQTVSYTAFKFDGVAYDNRSGSLVTYDLSSSTAQLTILANREMHPKIHLIGTAPGLPNKDFGTFEGLGTSGPSYSGTFDIPAETGMLLQAPFVAGIFGPQGKEAAVTFLLSRRPSATGGEYELVIAGRILATR